METSKSIEEIYLENSYRVRPLIEQLSQLNSSVSSYDREIEEIKAKQKEIESKYNIKSTKKDIKKIEDSIFEYSLFYILEFSRRYLDSAKTVFYEFLGTFGIKNFFYGEECGIYLLCDNIGNVETKKLRFVDGVVGYWDNDLNKFIGVLEFKKNVDAKVLDDILYDFHKISLCASYFCMLNGKRNIPEDALSKFGIKKFIFHDIKAHECWDDIYFKRDGDDIIALRDGEILYVHDIKKLDDDLFKEFFAEYIDE